MVDRQECRVFWGSRVAPEESIPMHAGTGKQSVFEHVDRRAELLPQSGAQRGLHQLFSHNVCSFLLLFSTCYHQKRSESTLISTVSFSSVTFFVQFECAPLICASSGEVSWEWQIGTYRLAERENFVWKNAADEYTGWTTRSVLSWRASRYPVVLAL